tara:strand:- start:12471 stop:12578 length:108 start_codon:yes stop_codon:yes gene_type:complete
LIAAYNEFGFDRETFSKINHIDQLISHVIESGRYY